MRSVSAPPRTRRGGLRPRQPSPAVQAEIENNAKCCQQSSRESLLKNTGAMKSLSNNTGAIKIELNRLEKELAATSDDDPVAQETLKAQIAELDARHGRVCLATL